jgi:outer membrane protein assembly factor BamA
MHRAPGAVASGGPPSRIARRPDTRRLQLHARLKDVALAVVAVAMCLHAAPLHAHTQPPTETIAEIRVHGNATINDEEVIRLAGLTVGAPLGPDAVREIEHRLRDSGRFDQVEVRKRYRTLAMDQVALVLLVHERPGVTAEGKRPPAIKRVTSRLMFLPILRYDDGYGWTYGARTSAVDLLGLGERLSVPLSWGATRRAALESERTFTSGPFTRVLGSLGISQRENPFYNVDDRRTEISGRVERRLFHVLTVGADAGRTNITFSETDGHFWTSGADATLDTRGDPAFPSDAVMLGAGWSRLHQSAANAVDRYRLDGRGYKRVYRQAVIALHAQYDTASAPLPPYEQWLLGGESLRGTPAGTAAGDKRLFGSVELRVPFSSPLSTGRVGFNVFMDAGADALYGQRLSDAERHRSAGAGLFIVAPIVRLNLDVARSLDAHGTRLHFGTGFTF